MQMFKTRSWLIALAVTALALPALAQDMPRIDYMGYGWDAVPVPEGTGEVLSFATVAISVDPRYEIDAVANQLTVYVYDLAAEATEDLGGGVTMTTYSGGFLDMYLDPDHDAAWGFDPPNAVAPGTFIDGTLFFHGAFTSFVVYYGPDGSGSFQGNLNALGGDMIAEPCDDCAYSVGGSFLPASGASLPQGYAMFVDGRFQIDETVSNEEMGWGRVKALYAR